MPSAGKTYVVILKGANRGRMGYIHGDFESRERRGITNALVFMRGEATRLRKLASMAEATPIEALCAETGNA